MPENTLASALSRPAGVLISVFIIAWLVWQLVVPLSYHLGDDVDDERFAWREELHRVGDRVPLAAGRWSS